MSLPTRRLAAAGLCLAAGLAGTALLSPPAQAAPGLTGKIAGYSSSALSDAPTKTVKHYCPPSKVVIGGGAIVEGPTHIRLTLLRPVQAGNYYEASARNPWGRAQWKLLTYAVCADPPPGLQYVAANSGQAAGVVRTATATCLAGKRVIGLGARAAAEPNRNVSLVHMAPTAGGTATVAESVAAQGGEPDDWTATAYAVCAAVPTTILVGSGPSDSAGSKYADADCGPGGLAAVGGALRGASAAGTGQLSFGQIYPDPWLQGAVVRAGEDHDGYAPDWGMQAYGICA